MLPWLWTCIIWQVNNKKGVKFDVTKWRWTSIVMYAKIKFCNLKKFTNKPPFTICAVRYSTPLFFCLQQERKSTSVLQRDFWITALRWKSQTENTPCVESERVSPNFKVDCNFAWKTERLYITSCLVDPSLERLLFYVFSFFFQLFQGQCLYIARYPIVHYLEITKRCYSSDEASLQQRRFQLLCSTAGHFSVASWQPYGAHV